MIFEKQPKSSKKEPKEKESREWINWAISRYWDLAIKIAWHYSKKFMHSNTDEFQDLFQSIMLKWLETIPKFQRNENLKAWLALVGTNVCKNYTRKYNKILSKQKTDEPKALDKLLKDYYFEENILTVFFYRQILKDLNSEQQKIAVMHFLHGYTNQEVADFLGRSKSTIERKVTEIKKMIQVLYSNTELEFSYQHKSFFGLTFENHNPLPIKSN
ncbi:MAG TPA: sigma-70 family RNA polymerase sigma factor [Patescibacteria group bacterium]|nr:sigma-70 family RNA polymerase sigma factor [Patescibacteria group bacterium]